MQTNGSEIVGRFYPFRSVCRLEETCDGLVFTGLVCYTCWGEECVDAKCVEPMKVLVNEWRCCRKGSVRSYVVIASGWESAHMGR
jgi:hypothetical protein